MQERTIIDENDESQDGLSMEDAESILREQITELRKKEEKKRA